MTTRSFNREISIFSEILKKNHSNCDATDILNIGCGNGTETASLSNFCLFRDSNVIGIDIDQKNTYQISRNAVIKYGDATHLDYSDLEFDLVYSYHVLEHVSDANKALAEIERVMKKKGILYIGTPNKQRVIGYVGGPGRLKDKIKWNLLDLKFRIQGKFQNKYGAHAGFGQEELRSLLKKYFNNVTNVTDDYYQLKVGNKIKVIKGISKHLYPSIYFVCMK